MKTLIFLLLFAAQDSITINNPQTFCNLQEILTIRIRENRVDCDGLNGRTQCYQIQKGTNVGSNEWEILPGEIENFRYEEGYQYDLSVEMTMLPNAPDEKSRYKYRLIEVLAKTKVR